MAESRIMLLIGELLLILKEGDFETVIIHVQTHNDSNKQEQFVENPQKICRQGLVIFERGTG